MDDESGTAPPEVGPAAGGDGAERAASAIGALADETRRALHDYVVGQEEPVTREQAATALGLPQHKAAFHLDRLADEGLLDVEYRRLTGRSGPGAGRPSKLYQRSARAFAVSVPQRHYDLVGDILATAVTRAATGEPLADSLDESARAEGRALGRAALDPAVAGQDELARVAEVLADTGYLPRRTDDAISLANCPFDVLARRHTALVCGLNRTFVQGVCDGLGAEDLTACLEPEPGACCVRVRSGA